MGRIRTEGSLCRAECSRTIHGSVIGRKVSRRGGYRCVYRDEYPNDDGHPRSIFVAETRIIGVLDEWLAELSSKNVDQANAAMLDCRTRTHEPTRRSTCSAGSVLCAGLSSRDACFALETVKALWLFWQKPRSPERKPALAEALPGRTRGRAGTGRSAGCNTGAAWLANYQDDLRAVPWLALAPAPRPRGRRRSPRPRRVKLRTGRAPRRPWSRRAGPRPRRTNAPPQYASLGDPSWPPPLGSELPEPSYGRVTPTRATGSGVE
jgi:hypothetical protein